MAAATKALTFVLILACFIEVSQLHEEQSPADKYKDPDGGDQETCSKDGQVGGECQFVEAKLTRLDGVKVGHEQTVELVPGKTHYLKTLNMKPLIFEIDGFLSDEECDHIIALAEKQGLRSSLTKPQGIQHHIKIYDFDGDKHLTYNEMRITIESAFDIYMVEDELKEVYAELKLDKNEDGLISQEELSGISSQKFAEFLINWVNENPELRSRYSEQAWIYPNDVKDDIVDEFQKRIYHLLELPRPLIDKFNTFQVVKYGIKGHYNAHIDSGDNLELPCCHLTDSERCRSCRYVTVMVYLNDVEEGGETAFPVANNETVSADALHKGPLLNLNRHCKDANLLVKPEKGKAVVWYSHFIDEETGWLGPIDEFTWHGGCPVTKGTKWIANRWINVSKNKEVDLKSSQV
ncbi:transmembrane prolyl 4-hydroxylase-like [Ptychodera flava]|uniref:transmembrane prolyl 4-hydroxylase-like n=1 Tax=Ptychodera flava TaxID=63121 RepID=UPI00396A8EE3